MAGLPRVRHERVLCSPITIGDYVTTEASHFIKSLPRLPPGHGVRDEHRRSAAGGRQGAPVRSLSLTVVGPPPCAPKKITWRGGHVPISAHSLPAFANRPLRRRLRAASLARKHASTAAGRRSIVTRK